MSSSRSVHTRCPAFPACSPYVAPAKPALHQGLYWLCRGRIVRGLYWPEQRRPILAVPPSQATHPLAPCEPFHPHGSDLPAWVLCVASTSRHMSASVSKPCQCVRVTFVHGIYHKQGSNQGLASNELMTMHTRIRRCAKDRD